MLRYPILKHFELKKHFEDIYKQAPRVAFRTTIISSGNLKLQKISTKYHHESDLWDRGIRKIYQERILLYFASFFKLSQVHVLYTKGAYGVAVQGSDMNILMPRLNYIVCVMLFVYTLLHIMN